MNVIAYLLIGLFALLALACFYFGVLNGKGRRPFIAIVYIIMFVYTIGSGVYYAKTVPDASPDESSHISYVYYLNETKEIIPYYEKMGTFNHFMMKWSTEPNFLYDVNNTNYLCHPPLYYHIMRLAGGFKPTEAEYVITIDKFRLRYFSLGLSAIGIALMLYIGYSRLDKSKPWIHFIYATTVTCLPMLTYELCAVTNDALALTTTAICILGLIRFCEKKRGILTYVLIAAGITASLLTKLTAAMLCIFMALIVLVVTLIKERSIKPLFCKEFFISVPIYLIAAAFYIIMYMRYGTFRPSLELICTPEHFKSTIYYVAESDRTVYTRNEYLSYYFERFFLSWSGIESIYRFLKTYTYSLSAIPYELLWVIPGLVFIPFVRKKAGSLSLPIISGWIACLLTFVYQLKSAYGTYLTRGYLGGFASRYYIPFMIIFGLALSVIFQCLLTENGFDAENETIVIKEGVGSFSKKLIYNQLIYLLGLGYAFTLFYGNLPFFLLHFAKDFVK